MSGFKLKCLGQIMEPEPGNSIEVEGILNPSAVAVLITTSTIVVAINASLLKVKE